MAELKKLVIDGVTYIPEQPEKSGLERFVESYGAPATMNYDMRQSALALLEYLEKQTKEGWSLSVQELTEKARKWCGK